MFIVTCGSRNVKPLKLSWALFGLSLFFIPGRSAAQNSAATPAPAAAAAARSALCEIVYQIDDGFPGPRGLRYLFFGNGFFINRDGYLLTAAHVLSQLHGGQPYLIIRNSSGQAQFVRADVIALDEDHDVAILRATPNPFDSNSALSFLALAPATAALGEMVHAASLSPSSPLDAYSLDEIREEHSPGEVLRFEFSQLEKGAAESQVFLFRHPVHPGQSGSPVIADDSQAVAGLVEGQWLRDDSYWLAAMRNDPISADAEDSAAEEVPHLPGAAVPIHYAIALLQRHGIAWHAMAPSAPAPDATSNAPSLTLPVPLSVVPAPYPSNSLFGGEVLLDALVARNGTLSDVKVIRGDGPFLKNALDAVRSWTFYPARSSGQAVDSRIAITFQFPQPYVPPRGPTSRNYVEGSSNVASSLLAALPNDVAVPLTTVEAEYPAMAATNPQGSVILYESIDSHGQLASAKPIVTQEPFTGPALAAANQWHFAPAQKAGAPVDSAAIVVVTFRHPLSTAPAAK